MSCLPAYPPAANILLPKSRSFSGTTDARPFWRDASVSPSNFGYPWNHNAESQFLNGTAMGKKMVEMLGK